ncbi:alpha/beta hydrolase [Nocardioides sp. GXZ039]|uniref:alpha/beta hydrolase n=1 Tax=Nocardioides sp. GXZ039 TaxID=3136018 RepID=UPI0030F3E55A
MTTTLAPTVPSDRPSDRPASPTAWNEPDGVAPRGTLILLTGRGESAAAYARFGRRIAADAYRVRVVELDLDDPGATADDVAALLADDDLPAPRVLAGSDAGASFAAVLVHGGIAIDGLVLAGPATSQSLADSPASLETELDARSACPAHRRVLADDEAFEQGALGRRLPDSWQLDEASDLAAIAVPTLLVHGSDDPVTPVAAALESFGRAAEVRVVEGGRHDVLNDVSHRSVAAHVVLFLERLRLGSDLPAIVREHL